MVGAAPLVLHKQRLRQAAVHGHPPHESSDAHIGGQHGAGEHDEGVHRHPRAEPLARRLLAHLGQHCLRVRVDDVHAEDAEGEQRDERVEEGDDGPHVAQRLEEDARRLLLHELRRRLEAADAEHGRAQTEEDCGEHVAAVHVSGELHVGKGGVVPVVGEVAAAVADGVDDAGATEEQQRGNVHHEDGCGHHGGLGESHEAEHGEEEEKCDGAPLDWELVPSIVEVLARLRGRHHASGDVGENGETGGHTGNRLGRGVQQCIIGTSVERKRSHNLAVDLAEQVQDDSDEHKRDGCKLACGLDDETGDVEARRGNVVPRDSGGWELPQLGVLAADVVVQLLQELIRNQVVCVITEPRELPRLDVRRGAVQQAARRVVSIRRLHLSQQRHAARAWVR
mmetsp:Transcript_15911/g.50688  ORF Transcript_15911/g.50688 Transcript_15911/m.50688 type:complete len:395 (-) Transcript_15911:85-1269(-)